MRRPVFAPTDKSRTIFNLSKAHRRQKDCEVGWAIVKPVPLPESCVKNGKTCPRGEKAEQTRGKCSSPLPQSQFNLPFAARFGSDDANNFGERLVVPPLESFHPPTVDACLGDSTYLAWPSMNFSFLICRILLFFSDGGKEKKNPNNTPTKPGIFITTRDSQSALELKRDGFALHVSGCLGNTRVLRLTDWTTGAKPRWLRGRRGRLARG